MACPQRRIHLQSTNWMEAGIEAELTKLEGKQNLCKNKTCAQDRDKLGKLITKIIKNLNQPPPEQNTTPAFRKTSTTANKPANKLRKELTRGTWSGRPGARETRTG